MSINQIKRNVAALNDKRETTINQLIQAYRNSFFKCKKCSGRTKLKKVIFVQTHWYEEPYSCTGGDRWHYGECNIICPKCHCRNRLLTKTNWENREKTKIKYQDFPHGISVRNIYGHYLDEYDDRYYNKSDSESKVLTSYLGIELTKIEWVNLYF